MRLMAINYYAGKVIKSTLILPIEIDKMGNLVGLRSDKLGNMDVKRVKDSLKDLSEMSVDERKEMLKFMLPSYNSALVEIKNGRYKIIEEFDI